MDFDKSYHMSAADFRKHGHALIDWLAEYQERVESLPVLAAVQPGEIRAALPPHPPQHGEDFAAMLADVDRIIMPGITHWQSPNFFAFFPSNNSGPSILGELLSAGLGVQGMLWLTSPACTELETHVMDWLVQMMGLPEAFLSTATGGGVIQESASNAALCALLAARERATAFAINARGGTGSVTAYCTAHTHSSVEKAMMIAGLGRENLRLVPADQDFAMRPDALAELIAADRAAGLLPAFVCANVGSTSSNAIDPVRAIGEVCRREGVWLHVDAAMSGTATVCPEFRWIIDGLELADSYCFNPHKWMFTNFDCDAFFVADRKALIDTLSILPEYLRNQATTSGAVIDYRDWQISLGRRFRALKLWFVIRHYGVEGLQHHIRKHVALAQGFAKWVEESEDFELAAPVPLNLVCLRHKGGDAVNEAILGRLNASGEFYLTHTKLDSRYTLRMSIGQSHTERRHVADAWRRIQQEAAESVKV
jgi:aromatic-L-amino-acid decarboxylase